LIIDKTMGYNFKFIKTFEFHFQDDVDGLRFVCGEETDFDNGIYTEVYVRGGPIDVFNLREKYEGTTKLSNNIDYFPPQNKYLVPPLRVIVKSDYENNLKSISIYPLQRVKNIQIPPTVPYSPIPGRLFIEIKE
jgi:hypothetical protein